MEAVIFVGLPASGKSTFYKQRFFHTHVRINRDMLRTPKREDILLRACIEAKQPFVVDNTNTTVERRAPYISLARAAGFRVVGYYFSSSVQECIRRNKGREGKAQVPDSAIWRFAKELYPPALEEGFDLLYQVRVDGNEQFVIEDWQPQGS